MIFLFGALAFVALGIWFLMDSESIAAGSSRDLRRSPIVIQVVGGLSITFFGFGFFLFARQILSKKGSLTLTYEGISNETTFATIPVSWGDVTAIKTMKINSTKLIGIYVKNPEAYMERQQGAWGKRLMKLNFNSYGTPIWIATNTLKEKHENVEALMIKYWKNAKSA